MRLDQQLALNNGKKLSYIDLQELNKDYKNPSTYKYDLDSVKQRGQERVTDVLKLLPWCNSHNSHENIKKVLDVGCGDGFVGYYFAKASHDAYAIDTNDWRNELVKNNVRFTKESIDNKTSFSSDFFDLILSFNAFEHFSDPESALTEMLRILKPGGYLYLDFAPLFNSAHGLHAYKYIHIPFCQVLFSKDDMDRYMSNDLHIDVSVSDPRPFVNEWSLRQYQQLWKKVEGIVDVVFYEEVKSDVAKDVYNKYNECFTLGEEEYFTQRIKVLFVKKEPGLSQCQLSTNSKLLNCSVMDISICSVCGGDEFKPGWKGRLTPTGLNPACVKCGSLERHRVFHDVNQLLPKKWFVKSKILKISDDKFVDKSLHNEAEITVSGVVNDFDIPKLDIPSEQYDCIMCNYVLGHVGDDVGAVSELLMSLKESGLLQVTVHSPLLIGKTRDWGGADPQQSNLFRFYGKDIWSRFASLLQGYSVFSYIGKDSVTGTCEIVYFVTQNEQFVRYFEDSIHFSLEPSSFVVTTFGSYSKIDYNLTTKTQLLNWRVEHQDFVSFREKMIGYSEKDYTNCNLKHVQDLCLFDFMRKHISPGSKVLEIGGGLSRILSFFKDDVEGWNLDKCEGIGNGPTKVPEDQGYTFLPAYIGSFDKKLPDAYFDLVFSISVVEHINEVDDVLHNILSDIDRVLKPGGYSVHCIDCRFPPKSTPSIDNRRLAKYMISHYGFSPQYVLDNHENEDVFHMSGEAYDKFWKKACHDRPHDLDGLPFNIFLAVQKQEA